MTKIVDNLKKIQQIQEDLVKNKKEKLSLPAFEHMFDCINKWRSLGLKNKNDEELYNSIKEFEGILQEWIVPSKEGIAKTTNFWRIRRVDRIIHESDILR